jgi:O-antigen/teichoic acid export membrane protein
MRGIRKLLLDLATTMGVRLLALPLALASSVIMARVLQPAGRGQYTTATTIGELAVVFGSLGVTTSALYYIARANLNREIVLATSLALAVVVGLAISAIFLLALPVLRVVSIHERIPTVMVLVVAPIGVLSLARSTLETFLRATHRVQAVNVVAVVASLYYLLAIAVIADFHQLTPARAVAARISMAGVGALAAYLFVRRAGISLPRPRLHGEIARRFLSYGVPYSIYTIFLMLSYRLDYLLLAFWTNSAAVGIYSISVTQAELLWILPVSVGFVLFPRAAARADQARSEAASETASFSRWTILVTVVCAASLALLARPLIGLMYGSAYLGAVKPLWLLLPGVVANVWLQTLGPYLLSIEKSKRLVMACAIGAVVNLGLNAILIPEFGASGAAVASSISYSVTGLVLVIGFYRLERGRGLNVLFPSAAELGSPWRAVRAARARA